MGGDAPAGGFTLRVDWSRGTGREDYMGQAFCSTVSDSRDGGFEPHVWLALVSQAGVGH